MILSLRPYEASNNGRKDFDQDRFAHLISDDVHSFLLMLHHTHYVRLRSAKLFMLQMNILTLSPVFQMNRSSARLASACHGSSDTTRQAKNHGLAGLAPKAPKLEKAKKGLP